MSNELMVPSTEQLEREIAPVVQQAGGMLVRTAQERATAMDFTRAVKLGQRKVMDFFGPMKESAHKTWKTVCNQEGLLLEPLKAAEETLKRKCLLFDQDQEHERKIEQIRLQALADEAARKERERLEKEAAKLKTPELREARLEQAAAVTAPVITVAAPEKPKGESTRKVWKARLVNKQALLEYAASPNELASSFLSFDQSAANRFAASTKGAVSMCGIEFYEESQLAIGGKS